MAKQKNKRKNKPAPQKISYKPQKTARIVNDALEISRQGNHNQAHEMLVQAAQREPRNSAIQLNLGIVCNILRLFAEAAEAFALAVRYENAAVKRVMTMGTGHFNAGRFNEAGACYKGVCLELSDRPEPLYHYAQVMLCLDNNEEAIKALMSALENEDSYQPAYYGLAQCGALTDELKSQLALQLDSANTQANKYGYYALGHYYHRKGEFEKAFDHFKQANSIAIEAAKQTPQQAVSDLTGHVRLLTELFNRDFFEQRSSWGMKGISPVFIVGMPLSGTRPLGQALAKGGNVRFASEFMWFNQVIFQLLGKNDNDFRKVIDAIDENMVKQMAGEYISSHSSGFTGAQILLDNNPYNFLNLWLVCLIFPEARIINCRRDKNSNMLACYFNDIFSQPFTLDLPSILDYYNGYEKIMSFWMDNLTCKITDYSLSDPSDILLQASGISCDNISAELGIQEMGILDASSAAKYSSKIPLEGSSLDFTSSATGNENTGLSLNFGLENQPDSSSAGLKLNFGGGNNSEDKQDFNLKF